MASWRPSRLAGQVTELRRRFWETLALVILIAVAINVGTTMLLDTLAVEAQYPFWAWYVSLGALAIAIPLYLALGLDTSPYRESAKLRVDIENFQGDDRKDVRHTNMSEVLLGSCLRDRKIRELIDSWDTPENIEKFVWGDRSELVVRVGDAVEAYLAELLTMENRLDWVHPESSILEEPGPFLITDHLEQIEAFKRTSSTINVLSAHRCLEQNPLLVERHFRLHAPKGSVLSTYYRNRGMLGDTRGPRLRGFELRAPYFVLRFGVLPRLELSAGKSKVSVHGPESEEIERILGMALHLNVAVEVMPKIIRAIFGGRTAVEQLRWANRVAERAFVELCKLKVLNLGFEHDRTPRAKILWDLKMLDMRRDLRVAELGQEEQVFNVDRNMVRRLNQFKDEFLTGNDSYFASDGTLLVTVAGVDPTLTENARVRIHDKCYRVVTVERSITAGPKNGLAILRRRITVADAD